MLTLPSAVYSFLIITLMLLNLLGGLVSGVWLGILGEWWEIGYGLLALFIVPLILGLALAPALLLWAPAGLLIEKGRYVLAAPLVVLANIYTVGLMCLWCMAVFFYFTSKTSPDNYIPLLIWSYGVALGPWIYMAQKERQAGGRGGEYISIFCAQVGYLIVSALVVFQGLNLLDLAIIFIGIMILGLLVQMVLAFLILVEQRSLEEL